jgi:hypothetical protein
MTRVAIVPVQAEGGAVPYRALAGDKQSEGGTAGQALDALAAQLPPDESGTLIVVQSPRPDRFFGAAQVERLSTLMGRWRSARDRGEGLPSSEQAELEALIDAELRASGERAAALAAEIGR